MKVLSVERTVLLEVDENTIYHITEKHDPISKTREICVKIWNNNINGFESKEHIYCCKSQIYRTKNDPVAEIITKAILTDKLFGLV